MIQRAQDIFPQVMIDELLRLSHQPVQPFVEFIRLKDPMFSARFRVDTWLERVCTKTGGDILAQEGNAAWVANGPKIIRPTLMDVEALSQVECRVSFDDYRQPYPALLVEFPQGSAFGACLCAQSPEVLCFTLMEIPEHKNDICTLVSRIGCGDMVENSLVQFDESCKDQAPEASKLLRAAANLCLLLSNYEVNVAHLFPKELERDAKLRRENSERGQRARERAKLALELVSFAQNVTLFKTESKPRDLSEPTGAEVSPHWRRGHLRRQPCGPQHSQRKVIFVPPVLVRADRFIGDKSNTQTVYT